METAKAKLTVLFDPPFWAGLFERECGDRYEVCKVTFGAEPKDYDVYAFVLEHYCTLDFSPALAAEKTDERTLSPKRAQRLAREQTKPSGVGTKAQQALQLQREQGKAERRVLSREAREAEEAASGCARRSGRQSARDGDPAGGSERGVFPAPIFCVSLLTSLEAYAIIYPTTVQQSVVLNNRKEMLSWRKRESPP